MTRITTILLYIISAGAIQYFLLIACYSGFKTSFLWFWPLLSACCIVYSITLTSCSRNHTSELSHRFSFALVIVFWMILMLFCSVEFRICRAAAQKPSADTEYLIVLGAQVRGDIPSLSLQARIDAAADYLSAHPSVKVLCSGGQGRGENKTEAAAIRDGLVARGINPNRMILEEESTSTRENLLNCLSLLPSVDCPVAIITNEFHCYRAGLIARRTGYTNSSTLSANQFLLTTPHYFVREFFALTKEQLTHHILKR